MAYMEDTAPLLMGDESTDDSEVMADDDLGDEDADELDVEDDGGDEDL